MTIDERQVSWYSLVTDYSICERIPTMLPKLTMKDIAMRLEEESIEPWKCHDTTTLCCVADYKNISDPITQLRVNIKLIDTFLSSESKKYKTPTGKGLIKTVKHFRSDYQNKLEELMSLYY